MNGFSDRGSTPLSSTTKKPKKCSVYGGFREFGKVGTGRFRPKKTMLNRKNRDRKTERNVNGRKGYKVIRGIFQFMELRYPLSGIEGKVMKTVTRVFL